MIDFCFFLKTYHKDYKRAACLIESYRKYNKDNIPLFCACPKEDKHMFEPLSGKDVLIIDEKSIYQNVFSENENNNAGYLNQQIYKLAFAERGLCANYMCLDSDALFIRDFYKKDFMYNEETPYMTLVEDNDLRADRYYNKQFWVSRREAISKIEDALDFHPYKLLTCHGFQIFSVKALLSLKREFMEKEGLDYKDIIEISPYEFSWYNLWVQKTGCIDIHICEPLFKCFHLKQQHMFYVLQGMKIEDWAKGYVGIIVNSNFGVGKGNYDDLKIYNTMNADIPDEIIIKNAKFFGKLRRGILKRKVISTLHRRMK